MVGWDILSLVQIQELSLLPDHTLDSPSFLVILEVILSCLSGLYNIVRRMSFSISWQFSARNLEIYSLCTTEGT